MKILGIIPARGGSKGVVGKNIRMLGDLPLIAYSINQANKSKLLKKAIISTDSEEIINISRAFNAEVPFKRPDNLALDNTSSIDVVQHAIHFFEGKGEFYDAICLLQPTYPFRVKGFIDNAIKKFINSDLDALVSVLKVPHEFNPHWVFEVKVEGILQISTGESQIIKRRQDLPDAYIRDGAVYITKTEHIKNGTFYGNKLGYIESNPEFYVNIDTIEDWKHAETKLPKIKSRI